MQWEQGFENNDNNLKNQSEFFSEDNHTNVVWVPRYKC
jgi:hypothetical protein